MQETSPPLTAEGSTLLEDPRACMNSRCKKGPEGARAAVKSPRAKYCCASCRVSVCRRNRPKPPDTDKPKRKPRKDKKYPSHAARQRAYERRKWGIGCLIDMSCMIERMRPFQRQLSA